MRRAKRICVLLAVLVNLCAATVVLASCTFRLTCRNPNCGYVAGVSFGGGFLFDEVTGYCVRDKQFVHMTWGRNERTPEPYRVLNTITGEMIDLHRCPKCGDPFLPIKSVKDINHCPKCGRNTLEYRQTICLD